MDTKIKLGMVQINNSFSRQSYFPYSVGILQACLKESLSASDRFEFLLPIYSRLPVKSAAKHLSGADIACFSTYVWNVKLSLAIAEEIKKNKPETLVVFGGPHVSDSESEYFLRSNPFVDITCHGEGEMIFPAILENYESRRWSKVPSVTYLDKKGDFIQTNKCLRISDLDKAPSPYLEGVFDPLIKANPQTEWVALWETNRGCPFSCAYCDWGSATKNNIYKYEINRLFKEIDWFSENKIEFVFCCDANFGMLKRDMEIVKYFAENKRKFGYPTALSVQSTKNFTRNIYEIYKIMSDSGISKGVSLSLQSLDEKTLKNIGRKNISPETFKGAQEKLTSLGIETFTDLILGLPGETYETFVDGASSVIENGQHNRIQFNNLSILPNAPMGDTAYQKKFGFDTVETKIINIHGSLDNTQELYEIQKLVVGTNSMPKSDWVKARVFGWMTALLHFNKLLQIPFVILNSLYGVGYRELIELFTESQETGPIFSKIRSFFREKAIDIQNGGVEFCESTKWLGIWWPADELILINLCTEGNLNNFYKEAQNLISGYLSRSGISEYQDVLAESIFLNKSLIKLPFQNKDKDISLSNNIWDIYYGLLRGKDVCLEKGNFLYRINCFECSWQSWEDWCREVIWYGNKKGAYIYSCKRLSPVLSSVLKKVTGNNNNYR